ncbi:hypothetical protein K7640_09485 [Micromonospora sp. PLK6-60]|uniref:hypothetical protein n=1 Tax=Micromonospora sp. PLK6-60 TaxID=2873383 RepID=UPI001CA7ACCA|nr:hypothetical protein [Micromonospora sp. PLK6-60]MBY8872070.1 hypothetical protein [Micromonospora sp. PLK6-60]
MSVADSDPVGLALRLVAVFLGLGLVVLGGWVATTRRFPAAWVRVARLTASQRAEPVRRGGVVALLGAGVLLPQVPFLAPVSAAVARALFVLALLLIVASVGWYTALRR